MYEYHILSQLKKYSGAKKCFHMPGHKAKGEFKKYFPVADLDVTELPYSDNLMMPDGIIAAAQKDIAEITGAYKSLILTDGSSCGVKAMLYALSKRGNKVIVPRNSHASVWDGCRVLGLEPVVVQGVEKEGVMMPPSPELIETLMVNDAGIAGILMVTPDYYGNIAPLESYAAAAHRHGRIFAADGAHGAHLVFEKDKKGYAGTYADVWVDGAHKTLPTLTQGAVLNVKSSDLYEDVKTGVQLFGTTSPSYPVMASVEYGYKYIANNPKIYERAKTAAKTFRESTSAALTFFPSDDWAKLAIDFKPLGVSPVRVLHRLEKKGVYAELSDGRYILFYLSAVTDGGELNMLKDRLPAAITYKKNKGTYIGKAPIPEGERTYSYQYALKRPWEAVELKDAEGRMSACNAGVTPPCIPVVIAGEIITPAVIHTLSVSKHTYGLDDGLIRVVKKS